jgi:hypothetical protein
MRRWKTIKLRLLITEGQWWAGIPIDIWMTIPSLVKIRVREVNMGKCFYDLMFVTKLNRETEFSWIIKTPK